MNLNEARKVLRKYGYQLVHRMTLSELDNADEYTPVDVAQAVIDDPVGAKALDEGIRFQYIAMMEEALKNDYRNYNYNQLSQLHGALKILLPKHYY